MDLIRPEDIKWIFQDVQNPSSPTPVVVYKVGLKNGQKFVLTEKEGAPLAKAMDELAKKEYDKQLVHADGSPINRIQQLHVPGGFDISYTKNGSKAKIDEV